MSRLDPSLDLTGLADRLARVGAWSALRYVLDDVEVGNLLESAWLSRRYGEALYHTGALEELADFAEEMERKAREREDMSSAMFALNLAGTAAFELGRTDFAQVRFETLNRMAEGHEDRELQAKAENNLGTVANHRGQPESALTHYATAEKLYRELESEEDLALVFHNQAISWRDLGRLERAAESASRAYSLATKLGNRFQRALVAVEWAEVELRRGDAEAARTLIREGLRHAQALEDPVSEASALRVRALIRGLEPDPDLDGALHDFHRAQSLVSRAGALLQEAEVERDWAEVLVGSGESHEARSHLHRAASLFQSTGAAGQASEARKRAATLG